MEENNNVERKGFTWMTLVRLLGLVCIILTFCPMFLVSCSGEQVEVDLYSTIKGISKYGESVDPQPILIICILIPIAILALSFWKKLMDRQFSLCIAGGMVIDFVAWICFKNGVANYAEENYCSFETTPWFYINLVVIICLIVISSLQLLKWIEMNDDVKKFANTIIETFQRK